MRIDGKLIADGIYESLREEVSQLTSKGTTPCLTVLLIGDNPASVSYVKQKKKWGEFIGAKIIVENFDTNISEAALFGRIKELNNDDKVHGILVQRPVPSQIDENKLIASVDPNKDIDGFHPESTYVLPLPLAVVKILEEVNKMQSEKRKMQNNSNANIILGFKEWMKEQKIVILGKGQTGGGPISAYLIKLGLRVNIVDSKTPNPEIVTKNADIIISAVGKPGIISSKNIKKGVILIGAGIFRGDDGKLHGDYSEADIENTAGFYTPTPGGVGPVNVAMLMDNLVNAARRQSQN